MQYLWIVHVYTCTCTQCGYTRHLHTCRYAAILVNRPSGISQAAAIDMSTVPTGLKGVYTQKY